MARIAILGWGSLCWDPKPEFDQWHEEWRPEGPTLKLEFSRVSTSRRGALTLVIDPLCGAANTVLFTLSRRPTVDDALADLTRREGTTPANIGFVYLAKRRQNCRDPESAATIGGWAAKIGMEAVIWTDLPSNFAERTGTSFSVPSAIDYLRGLDPFARGLAVTYISRAPAFIRTPLRSALETTPWFASTAAV